MRHQLLNLLLAMIILSCPLRCQLGLTGCYCGDSNSVQSETDACCCDPESESSPCPPPELPGKKCQCICSGATMPDHFDIDWTFECQPICELVPPAVIQPQFLLASDIRPPDYRTRISPKNLGREIRCVCSSLII